MLNYGIQIVGNYQIVGVVQTVAQVIFVLIIFIALHKQLLHDGVFKRFTSNSSLLGYFSVCHQFSDLLKYIGCWSFRLAEDWKRFQLHFLSLRFHFFQSPFHWQRLQNALPISVGARIECCECGLELVFV